MTVPIIAHHASSGASVSCCRVPFGDVVGTGRSSKLPPFTSRLHGPASGLVTTPSARGGCCAHGATERSCWRRGGRARLARVWRDVNGPFRCSRPPPTLSPPYLYSPCSGRFATILPAPTLLLVDVVTRPWDACRRSSRRSPRTPRSKWPCVTSTLDRPCLSAHFRTCCCQTASGERVGRGVPREIWVWPW